MPSDLMPEVTGLQNKRQDHCGHINLRGVFQTTTWYSLMSSRCLNSDLICGQKKTIPLLTGKAFEILQ